MGTVVQGMISLLFLGSPLIPVLCAEVPQPLGLLHLFWALGHCPPHTCHLILLELDPCSGEDKGVPMAPTVLSISPPKGRFPRRCSCHQLWGSLPPCLLPRLLAVITCWAPWFISFLLHLLSYLHAGSLGWCPGLLLLAASWVRGPGVVGMPCSATIGNPCVQLQSVLFCGIWTTLGAPTSNSSTPPHPLWFVSLETEHPPQHN